MRSERNQFLTEHPHCAVCGAFGGVVSVHEMTPGKNRMRAFQRRELWLPACYVCNCNILTDREKWPLPAQLALKLALDPRYFSLDVVNEVLAPEGAKVVPEAVSASDVLFWVQRFFLNGRWVA